MPTRSLNVQITGDVAPLKRELATAGKHVDQFGEHTKRSFERIKEAGKLLAEVGGLTALTFGLKDVTEEAVKADAQQRQLAATVKAAGQSWREHGKEIEEWLGKASVAS